MARGQKERAGGGEAVWVVVGPSGVRWVGLAADENAAWTIALGWPDADDIALAKRQGWYAAEASLSWRKPDVFA